MPWTLAEKFVPCCNDLSHLIDNLPYYRTDMRKEGLTISRFRDCFLEVNYTFKYCPFCNAKLDETDGA